MLLKISVCLGSWYFTPSKDEEENKGYAKEYMKFLVWINSVSW